MLDPYSIPRFKTFTRRLHLALFLGALVDALLFLAVSAGISLLILRLFDMSAEPNASYAILLLVPVAWAYISMRRRGLPANLTAAHLDRRLGLGGLLISGLETDPGAWQAILEERLERCEAELPTIHKKTPASKLAFAAIFLFGILLLPPPVGSVTTLPRPLMRLELADMEEELRLAKELGLLSEEKAKALAERIDKIEKDMAKGEKVDWRDIDKLAASIAQEKRLSIGRLAKAQAALAEFQDGKARTPGETSAAFEDLLNQMGKAGLMDEISPELAKKLEAAMPGFADAMKKFRAQLMKNGSAELAKSDLSQLDIEQMKMLASAFAESLQDLAGKFSAMELKNAAELADLAAMLRKAGLSDAATAMPDATHEHDASCAGGQCNGKGSGQKSGPIANGNPGRGGINRGRGDAELQFSNQSKDGGAAKTKKLPRGQAISREWELVGFKRAQPEVAPDRKHNGPGKTDSGSGTASWNLRLAPRHRELVRKFFTTRDKKAKKQ